MIEMRQNSSKKEIVKLLKLIREFCNFIVDYGFGLGTGFKFSVSCFFIEFIEEIFFCFIFLLIIKYFSPKLQLLKKYTNDGEKLQQ